MCRALQRQILKLAIFTVAVLCVLLLLCTQTVESKLSTNTHTHTFVICRIASRYVNKLLFYANKSFVYIVMIITTFIFD